MWFWKPRQSFIFHPILMGFFSLDSSQWELFNYCSQFFLSCTVFEIQGAYKDKKNYFQWNVNLLPYHVSKTHYCVQYITVSNTLWCQASTRIKYILKYSSVVNMLRSYHAALAKPLSFHWIPLNESFQNCLAYFCYLLPFSRYKGPKWAKTFLRPHQIFIFHPILMGFFSLDSSLTVLEIQGAQLGILIYCQIYHFSQTHCCVQYITVSNTLLRQASTRSIFILM